MSGAVISQAMDDGTVIVLAAIGARLWAYLAKDCGWKIAVTTPKPAGAPPKDTEPTVAAAGIVPGFGTDGQEHIRAVGT